jgi:DNA-binding transcriptional ArsR family regulator
MTTDRTPADGATDFDALERLFHEPNRLAIMSALCAADGGLTFNELKDACVLTDGNLNRHLKALEEAGAVRVEKTFVGVKPRTTVFLSDRGLTRFREYLDALEAVLDRARRTLPERRKAGAVLFGRTVKV